MTQLDLGIRHAIHRCVRCGHQVGVVEVPANINPATFICGACLTQPGAPLPEPPSPLEPDVEPYDPATSPWPEGF